jgi:ribosome biogenesis GTPase
MDLVEEEPAEVNLYRDLAMPVLETSCVSGQGLEALRASLRGQHACLAGHSGVGKSSLINALDPRYDIHTQEISDQTKKGRHTTTTSRLYHLHGDIHIVDTPGIKQLGLWGVTPEEVDFYFPEMKTLAPHCKFRDCTHLHEPDCAVREAIDSGAIAAARYESYKRIRESLQDT